MVRRPKEKRFVATRCQHVVSILFTLAAIVTALPCGAQQLDEMSLDRWKVLREVERYQLNIAERYYKEKNWKVALSEYDKYLTLYEDSEAASHVQLKWSICQVNLRKSNTAIKEGFQSVIDYWPDSPDALAASYFIGRTYKDIGQIPKAKKAYQTVVSDHANHLVAVRSMIDLIDISVIESDEQSRVKLWKKLTFDIKRTDKETQRHCINAATAYSRHCFANAAFSDGVKALATNYEEGKLPADVVVSNLRTSIQRLTQASETKAKGDQLTQRAVSWLREQMPTDLLDEQQKALAKQSWYYIADLHAVARHDDEVPKVYDQIKAKFGVDDDTLGRLAAWYKYYLKEYDKARQIYRQFKDKVAGLNQVAYSYREQRKTDEAVATYNQILGLDPESAIKWKSEIAASYRSVQKYLEAIAAYEELLSIDAKNASSWRWQMATAYHEAGKFKEAIGNYLKCTNEPSNYMQIALCNRSLKQYNEALLYYNQVITNYEQSAPEALFQIARTHEQSQKKESAIKAFQQVCKRYPKSRRASDAHAHLQNEYKISVTLGGAADK